jgi:glutamine synthetase
LLRALSAIDEAATDVLFLIKCKEGYCYYPRLEQEYFLIDRSLAESRPDLMMTGRTLLHTSARDNN